jgi:hypothetical protein
MDDQARKDQIHEAAKQAARKHADDFFNQLKGLALAARARVKVNQFTKRIKTRKIPIEEAANIILSKRRKIEKRRKKAKERRR